MAEDALKLNQDQFVLVPEDMMGLDVKFQAGRFEATTGLGIHL